MNTAGTIKAGPWKKQLKMPERIEPVATKTIFNRQNESKPEIRNK
jgi:hypothetical protein